MLPTHFSPHASPGLGLHAVGGDRLQALIHSFEAYVDTLSESLYQLVCDVSPFPFEWTVLTAVFLYVTVRQVILWVAFDAKPAVTPYVYWHTHDHIDVEVYEGWKPQQHLSTALLVYITQKLWREQPLTAAEVNNKTFTMHLLSLFSNELDRQLENYDSDEDSEVLKDEKTLLPVKLPIYPHWTPVHESGVEMCTWITTLRTRNSYPEADRFIYLRVRKGDGADGGSQADAVLRRFVDNAVRFYFASDYCDCDDHGLRVFHTSSITRGVIRNGAPLPLAPTLDTVFFPQRDAVRVQLQRFLEKKGRYAIKGFPQKLGYLLYGPRGTGKRSFVRALAYHTKRHIVRISLSNLRKNEELFNIFNFESPSRSCSDEWEMLTSKKVIFLIEDVDTDSDLVKARGASHTVRIRRSRGLTTRSSVACKEDTYEHRADTPTKAKQLMGEDEEDDALTTSPPVSTTPRAADAVVTVTTQKRTAPPAALRSGWGHLFSKEDAKLDAVNLSSLLNVLDGAVEEPDRIVVMIADHPERLDPALLRPGRFSTHLRFDYIELDDLVGLCGLFYGAECLDVRGTLTSAPATRIVHPSSSGSEYSRAETDSAGELPQFPHLLKNSSADASPPEPAPLVPVVAADENASLLSWQRRAFQSPEMAKIEQKVVRQLSKEQATCVRECIEELEKEESFARRAAGREFDFLITPSQAHHLCKRADTLDGFLKLLRAHIRRNDS